MKIKITDIPKGILLESIEIDLDIKGSSMVNPTVTYQTAQTAQAVQTSPTLERPPKETPPEMLQNF